MSARYHHIQRDLYEDEQLLRRYVNDLPAIRPPQESLDSSNSLIPSALGQKHRPLPSPLKDLPHLREALLPGSPADKESGNSGGVNRDPTITLHRSNAIRRKRPVQSVVRRNYASGRF